MRIDQIIVRRHSHGTEPHSSGSSTAATSGSASTAALERGPLNREHAVPYGLNGPWTLLRASCDDCARITHKFERDTLRSLWPTIRNALRMQTRRPMERTAILPLVVVRASGRQTIQIPRERYPIYLQTPLFPAPGAVCGRPPRRGVFTNLDVLHIAGPSFKEISAEYPGAEFVGMQTNFSPEDFARTIAKIAYCAAVFALGVGPFTNSPVKAVILGKDENIGHWVGCWSAKKSTRQLGCIRCGCFAAALTSTWCFGFSPNSERPSITWFWAQPTRHSWLPTSGHGRDDA